MHIEIFYRMIGWQKAQCVCLRGLTVAWPPSPIRREVMTWVRSTSGCRCLNSRTVCYSGTSWNSTLHCMVAAHFKLCYVRQSATSNVWVWWVHTTCYTQCFLFYETFAAYICIIWSCMQLLLLNKVASCSTMGLTYSHSFFPSLSLREKNSGKA